MKNEKGFTLVEMISVLVIMSVLFMISFPSILNAIKSTSIKLSDSEKIIVEDAITDYLNDNNTYEQNNGDNYCVSISSLLEEGYLTEEEITEIDPENIVNVSVNNDEINIDLNNVCINETKQVYFRLRGSKSMEINKGNTYTEQGIDAKDKDNNDVSDQVIIKYYDKDMHEITSINTQFVGKYIVEYILEIDDKKYVIERSVEVIVSDDPVIVHPGDITIGDTEMAFDLLDGVSATDSEGKELGVTVKTNLTLGIVGNYNVEYKVTDKNNKTITNKRYINIIEGYSELILNGTKPVINGGMIPVTIENNGIVKKANIEDEWYSYENKEWANIVLVTDSSRNTYKNANPNTSIENDDILAYFVWIPRYKYRISTSGTSTPSSIDIIFEDKNSIKSNGNAVDEYYSHPAFTFGDEELNGIWVAKFETTGTETNPTVLPNVISLTDQDVSTQFETAMIFNDYGTLSDSHMMKNIEWGATSYLSHSIYGINGEIRANNNGSYVTGCGSNKTNFSTIESDECQIAYGSSIANLPQSTTGNITGIFDMAGGAFDRVMGNYKKELSYSGFEKMPDKKYYDLYETSTFDNACNGNRCLGIANEETDCWYYDAFSEFVYSQFSHDSSWALRGGFFDFYQGVFYTSYDYGSEDYSTSFRVVLG